MTTPDAAPDVLALEKLISKHPGPHQLRWVTISGVTYGHIAPSHCTDENNAATSAVVKKANALPSVLIALAASTATVARLESELATAHARIARIEAGVIDDVRANHGLPPLPRSTS